MWPKRALWRLHGALGPAILKGACQGIWCRPKWWKSFKGLSLACESRKCHNFLTELTMSKRQLWIFPPTEIGIESKPELYGPESLWVDLHHLRPNNIGSILTLALQKDSLFESLGFSKPPLFGWKDLKHLSFRNVARNGKSGQLLNFDRQRGSTAGIHESSHEFCKPFLWEQGIGATQLDWRYLGGEIKHDNSGPTTVDLFWAWKKFAGKKKGRWLMMDWSKKETLLFPMWQIFMLSFQARLFGYPFDLFWFGKSLFDIWC